MKTIFIKSALVSGIIICSSAATASSSDNGSFQDGDMMVRVRGLDVVPDVDSSTSIGGAVKVDTNLTPEMDLSYFFTPNVSVEVIAAVTKHDLKHSSGTNAGTAWLLPPTATLQYHITEWQSILPYVGAGVNYTHFYDEKGGALGSVKYDDSVGGALQAGVDIPLGGNWYANADVKKLFVSTTAKFSNGVRADVDLDPWLFGVGIGYKF